MALWIRAGTSPSIAAGCLSILLCTALLVATFVAASPARAEDGTAGGVELAGLRNGKARTTKTLDHGLGTVTEQELDAARAALRRDAKGNAVRLTADDYAALPERIRLILTTPASETSIVTVTDAAPASVPRMSRAWEWQGWHRGCKNITNRVSHNSLLGNELVRSTTRIFNVCTRDGEFLHEPTVSRTLRSYDILWTTCGWDGTFETWLDDDADDRTSFYVGGAATFAYTWYVGNLCDNPALHYNYTHVWPSVQGSWAGWYFWRD